MANALRNQMMAGALAAGIVLALPGAAFAASAGTNTAATTTTTSNGSSTSSGPAQASSPRCTPGTFTQAQQLVETALSNRVTQLNNLVGAVDNSSNHLTSSDKFTLANDLTGVELPGIQALQPEAQSAGNCAQLRTVAHAMVFSFRVYIVMTPQTHLTIVVDDETYVEGVFTNLESTITNAIAAAKAQGRDVTAAQGAFNDLQTQVMAAQSETSGLSSTVLAQTPAGAPGNWQVFLSARTSATNARNDLRVAYGDLAQIRMDLA